MELLDALTRVAEEALQPPASPQKRGVGPYGRGAIVVSSSAQGSSNAFAAGCQPEHVGVPPVEPLSVEGMRTLQVTTADSAAVEPCGRRAAGITVQDLHIECGARESRRGVRRKVGKRYSSDSMGDGPSARTKRKRARDHQQDHVRLRHADGSIFTEEEQVALVMALSDTGGASSSAPIPAPTPTPTPTPSPMPQVSLLVTYSTRPAPVHALAPPALSTLTEAASADGSPDRLVDVASILSVEPHDGVVPEGVTSNGELSEATALGEPLSSRTGDSPDVEVVTGPPRPAVERIDIADDHLDTDVTGGDPDICEVVTVRDVDAGVSGGSSDVHDEVVDSSDVEAVGGVVAEPRFPAPTPSIAPLLQRGRPGRPRATRRSWHDDANRQCAAENWHVAANRQY